MCTSTPADPVDASVPSSRGTAMALASHHNPHSKLPGPNVRAPLLSAELRNTAGTGACGGVHHTGHNSMLDQECPWPAQTTLQPYSDHLLQQGDPTAGGSGAAIARTRRRAPRVRAPRLPYVLACMNVDDVAMQRIFADSGGPRAEDGDLTQALQELRETASGRVEGLLGLVQAGAKRGGDLKRILTVSAKPMCEREVRPPVAPRA